MTLGTTGGSINYIKTAQIMCRRSSMNAGEDESETVADTKHDTQIIEDRHGYHVTHDTQGKIRTIHLKAPNQVRMS